MSADRPASSPRRVTRFLIFAPATLLAAVLAGFSGGWWWAQGRLCAELDGRVAALRQAGWDIGWRARAVTGFPFRLKVVLTDARAVAPGEHAWGVSAPVVEAQAYLLHPTHWVFAAANGLTLRRPMGGSLTVAGKDLRASVAGVEASPWRIALAGDQLAFSIPAEAKPFSFSGMDHFEAHLRPSADASGDGDVLVEVDGGKAAPASVLHRLVPDAPINVAASGRLLKLGAAQGAGWSAALDAWSRAGGALRLDRLNGVGGATHVEAKDALLGVDADGRLEGSIPLALRQEPEAPAPSASPVDPAAAAQQAVLSGAAAQLPVIFKDGRMQLGPLEVGPAPMIR